MSVLDNGVVIDQANWTSPNFTPGSQSTAAYGMPRKVKGVTVHHWGLVEWNQKFGGVADYLSRPNGDTSAHFVVEDGRVACLVSPDDIAWHAGSAEGNATTIGVEMHPRASEGDMATLASLIRYLEGRYGSLNVYRHQDWSSTACPGAYANKIDRIIELVNQSPAPAKAAQTVPTPKAMTIEPVKGYPVTQNFGDGANLVIDGVRTNVGGGHTGIDYATPEGVPAVALESGTVLWADYGANLPRTSWDDRWYLGGGGFGGLAIDPGLVIVIQHPGYISTYSHMSTKRVNVGDRVTQGQVVGLTGSTGFVSGAHLHFEVIPDGSGFATLDNGSMIFGRVDPRPYFTQTVEDATAAFSSQAVVNDDFLEEILALYNSKAEYEASLKKAVQDAIRDEATPGVAGKKNVGSLYLLGKDVAPLLDRLTGLFLPGKEGVRAEGTIRALIRKIAGEK